MTSRDLKMLMKIFGNKHRTLNKCDNDDEDENTVTVTMKRTRTVTRTVTVKAVNDEKDDVDEHDDYSGLCV